MCTCLDITNVLPAGLYNSWAVATVQTLPVSVMRFTLRGGGRNRQSGGEISYPSCENANFYSEKRCPSIMTGQNCHQQEVHRINMPSVQRNTPQSNISTWKVTQKSSQVFPPVSFWQSTASHYQSLKVLTNLIEICLTYISFPFCYLTGNEESKQRLQVKSALN